MRRLINVYLIESHQERASVFWVLTKMKVDWNSKQVCRRRVYPFTG